MTINIDELNELISANDKIADPFQPEPTNEMWTAEENIRNRRGTLIRSGLYLHDRKSFLDGLDENKSLVEQEASTRQASDKVLDTRLTEVESNIVDANAWKQPLLDETNARIVADTLLTNTLAKEVVDRTSADNKLTQDLAKEKTDRTLADTTLQNNIDNQATYGSALSLKSKSNVVVNSLLTNGTISIPVQLQGVEGIFNSEINKQIPGSPLSTEDFWAIIHYDGDTKLNIIAENKVSGTRYISPVIEGVLANNILTLNADTVWHKMFDDNSIVPIANGGNGNDYGEATYLNAQSITINSLVAGGTIVGVEQLEGHYLKVFGNLNAQTPGSPAPTASFHCYCTSDGSTAFGIMAIDIVHSLIYVGICIGTFDDKTFTVSSATWKRTDATGIKSAAYKDAGNGPGQVPVIGSGGQLDPSIVPNTGGGSGAVNSVNGKTGAVTLYAGDITASASDTTNLSDALDDKLDIDGTATKATQLENPRTLKVDLTSTAATPFDGTTNANDIGISGILPIINGGTGNANGLAEALTNGPVGIGADLDTFKTSGWYHNTNATGITNVPSGTSGTFFTLEVIANSTNSIMQRYWDITEKKWFIRGSSGNPGVWAEWTEVGASDEDILPILKGGTGRTDGLAQGIIQGAVNDNDDLDSLNTSGIWIAGRLTGVLHLPTGVAGTFFIIETEAINEYNAKQTYYDTNTNQYFIRNREGQTWHDWKEVSFNSGLGSVIYAGQFNFDSTNTVAQPDTSTVRATGAVINIKGNDSNIVTADPEHGVALFTNPTNTDITVILNAGFTLNRTSGTSDTLPKKFNIAPVNADIGGGITDASHLSDAGSIQLTAGGLGATNRNVISPAYFTVPANGKFRLSYSIDGYGDMHDTYTTQATMNYVAFRQDAKVLTESIAIPWSPLTGANGGTAGEYKKIGSWTVVRWNITTSGTAGSYGIGTIPDVDARPESGLFIPVADASSTSSETQHMQINEKTNSGAGAITILNALANKSYRGQIVFNNGGPETVSIPYLVDDDIAFGSVPLHYETGYSAGYSSTGFEIRGGWLYVNINQIITQSALAQNSTTKIASVPNVTLPADIQVRTDCHPGTSNRTEGYMELRRDGSIYFHNYDAIPVQTGSNHNSFYGSFVTPLLRNS